MEMLLNQCKSILKELAVVSKLLRQTQAKTKSYLITLEKKFLETADGKYKFALNKIKTLLYQINICLKDLLELVDAILQCCSVLNFSGNTFKIGAPCLRLEEQDNYRELKSPEDLDWHATYNQMRKFHL